jgi:hypothetical protein
MSRTILPALVAPGGKCLMLLHLCQFSLADWVVGAARPPLRVPAVAIGVASTLARQPWACIQHDLLLDVLANAG